MCNEEKIWIILYLIQQKFFSLHNWKQVPYIFYELMNLQPSVFIYYHNMKRYHKINVNKIKFISL